MQTHPRFLVQAIIPLALVYSVSAVTAEKHKWRLPSSAQVIVGLAGQDRDDHSSDGCRKFKLNEKQVREIFSDYHELTSRELHDHYLWAPCYVDGIARVGARTFNWRIRAGNTLETTYPDGKKKVLGGAYTDSPSGE